MDKIQMKTPLVEMDGDEMTRVIWKMIKDILLAPYIDLNTEYYDLGLVHSVEAFDKHGTLIIQFFGKRKPNIPEREDWRALVKQLEN